MSSATLTSPPTATARLVVDTYVASFVFKWHPEFAPRYVAIMRGSELVVSFMTLAEMRHGAFDGELRGRANAMCLRHTWPTSQCFTLTPGFALCGPPFGTRARARDVK